MTNLIGQLLGDTLDPLLGQLQNLGFNDQQALLFLSHASEETLHALQEEDERTDISSIPEQDLLDLLLDKINTDALATKVGIENRMAAQGLPAILPTLIHVFSNASALGNLGGLWGQPYKGIANKLKVGLGKLN